MARIHPSAVVSSSADIADNVEIGPFCVVEDHTHIGARTRLLAHVTINAHTRLGEDCVVFPNAVLGGWPQDRGFREDPTRLDIGNRNIIREGVTMNRGTMKDRQITRVGDDGFFMAGAHVAHDCVVGNGVIFANGATLGGHCVIGNRVIISGFAALHQFSHVGDAAFIGGLAKVVGDVIPFGMADGNPARMRGLNLVGLKRSGMARAHIHALRRAYREIFEQEGALAQQDRLDALQSEAADVPALQAMLDFVTSERSGRELMRA